MVEPAHSTPAPNLGAHDSGTPDPEVSGVSVPESLSELFVQELPKLPSLAALHALTDRDLPSTDGRPMPESMVQDEVLGYTAFAFRRFFKGRSPGVCVASNLLVYDDGRPAAGGPVSPVWVSPDILVAFGVEERMRDSYVIWREGKAPDFVMEVVSKSTWRRDRDEKPALYASLGVAEYFLYDPVGGFLEPRLQGRKLRDGDRRALRQERLPNGARGLRSEVLGLCAYLRGPRRELRWYDLATGKDLEDYDEIQDELDRMVAARRAAEHRAAEETAARQAAEAELAELRVQIRRLQRGPRR